MITVLENCPLLSYNTFGIEAYAKFMTVPGSAEAIMELLNRDVQAWNPKFVLGGGSNVLFTGNFEGLILHPQIKGIETTEENDDHVWIRTGCAEPWDEFVKYCVDRNLGGLENLSLIPGTVGACPVQNIGAYGVEIKDCIEKVEGINIMKKTPVVFSAKDCKFGYRDSIFKQDLKDQVIITHVTFRLSKNPVLKAHYPDLKKELKNYPELNVHSIRQAVIAIRRRKLPDPAQYGNAGSFFKNPVIPMDQAEKIRQTWPDMPGYDFDRNHVKLSAAWLIDKCKLKGKKIGQVGTYKNQPLVIINYGHANGNEVVHFALKIQQAVLNRFGVLLEIEVNVL